MVFNDSDILKVNYTVKQGNETIETTIEEIAVKEGIFDEKRKYKPIVAIVGDQNFFSKVDEELKKMSIGEKKKIKLLPQEAFGDRKPELIKMVALKDFRQRKITPFPGLVVDLNGAQGKVQSVSGGRVRVDFNHPLAGKEIEFEIEAIEKVEGEEQKAQAIAERFLDLDSGKGKIKIEGKTLSVEAKAGNLGNNAMRESFAKTAFKSLGIEKVYVTEAFEKEEKKPKESKIKEENKNKAENQS